MSSSSGFTGSGASEFFTAPNGGFKGRSISQPLPEATLTAPTMNHLNLKTTNHLAAHPFYRSQQHLFQQQQQHLPTLFHDPSAQIARPTQPNWMGKRNLADFQKHQNNPMLSNLLLRSVKPRTFQQGSSLSPTSPMDFSMSPELLNNASPVLTMPSSQRVHSIPLVQQNLRSNQVHLSHGSTLPMSNNAVNAALLGNPNGSDFYLKNTDVGQVQKGSLMFPQESEKEVMDHRLLELEKQLLEDDNDEGDAVSVITNNEWSDAIQNLIAPATQNQKPPISTSPTSSTTSSTCSTSSSVASPASSCTKQSLMEAASAISEGKSETAGEILTRLAQISNPDVSSDQRLTDCMAAALKSRVNPTVNPPQIMELFSKEHNESTQFLYDMSPCFKLGFMAANLAILEATLDDEAPETKFHVIDFDVGQGNQYCHLLHALSARQNEKPTAVKITAIADSGNEDKLQSVGDMLRCLAERVGFYFEFKVVSRSHRTIGLSELSRNSLGCDPDESIAVNFAFNLYKMPDESVTVDNPRDSLLRQVKGLAPKVVTVVEQELNTNTAPFMSRVTESLSYYGALFDSLESTVSRDNSGRVKVEEGLSRKLSNSIACEGRDRVERCEVFGKWKARMGMAGFELQPMSQNVAESLRARVNSGNRVNPGFTVKQENGGICFGWMGRTLTVASAWR